MLFTWFFLHLFVLVWSTSGPNFREDEDSNAAAACHKNRLALWPTRSDELFGRSGFHMFP